MSATNEPVSILVDIPVSTADLVEPYHAAGGPCRVSTPDICAALPVSAAAGALPGGIDRAAFGRRPSPAFFLTAKLHMLPFHRRRGTPCMSSGRSLRLRSPLRYWAAVKASPARRGTRGRPV